MPRFRLALDVPGFIHVIEHPPGLRRLADVGQVRTAFGVFARLLLLDRLLQLPHHCGLAPGILLPKRVEMLVCRMAELVAHRLFICLVITAMLNQRGEGGLLKPALGRFGYRRVEFVGGRVAD